MKELPEKEVLAQLEKAYARATVALIRAQKLCIIMDPGHTGAAWGRYRNRLSQIWCRGLFFFLLYAAWVRSRAERPSVSYTKVVMEVAWTGHNCNLQRRIKQQNCGSNKFLHRGGREDETDARAEHQTHWLGASNEWMMEPRKMQCRASNPLARRIKGWSPKTCLGRPARKTRRTEVMKMKGSEGENTNK